MMPHNPNGLSPDLVNLIKQAQQNPHMLEELLRQNNPKALEQAINIRNNPDAKAIMFQMAQQKGFPPDILKMLGLM